MKRDVLSQVAALAVLTISLAGCGEESNGTSCEQRVVVEDGDGQTGSPGATLSIPLTTYAIDCDSGSEIGFVGGQVIWTARHGLINGVVSDTLVTDSTGRSTVSWTLASFSGPQSVAVEVFYPLTGVRLGDEFHATAVAVCAAGATPHGDPQQTIFSDQDETWGAGNHMIVGSIQFTGTATLTILAGAQICVDRIGVELQMTDSTAIRILGTAAHPVRINAAEGSLRIENYSNRPVDSPVHSIITNARLEAVSIEGYNYDIDSTFVRGGGLVLEGASHLRASTTDQTDVTIIARTGMSGDYEATFMSSNQAMRVMGVGGDLTFHGCEFSYLTALDISSFNSGITIEQSNFQSVTVTSGARADSVDARNNYWNSVSGPGSAVPVSGPIRTVPFRTSPATIGYRPQ